MRETPSDRLVVFPEPLRHAGPWAWFVAGLSVCVVVGVGAWYVARPTAAAEPVGRARGALSSPTTPAPPKRAPVSTPLPRPVTDQAGARESAIDRGVVAYEMKTYNMATSNLRVALQPGPDSLVGASRVRALTFLAAAEVARGRRDSAAAAFRQLLIADPNRAPDSTIFPPAVLQLYSAVRSEKHGVARIKTTPDGVALTVVALAPHRIGVGVRKPGSAPMFELFNGVVKDSVVVTWNGLMPSGSQVEAGSYELVLVAFLPDGGVSKAARFSVLAERVGGRVVLRAPDAPLVPSAQTASGGKGREFVP